MKNAKKASLVLAAAGIAVSVSAGSAFADSHAAGGALNSPGVVSGNHIQVPVNVPVTVSGNSVNVIGLLNPAFGNRAGD